MVNWSNLIRVARSAILEELTLLEGGHCEDTREHPLVVSVQYASDASKGGNGENTAIFDQGCWPRRAHEGLPTMQCRIVNSSGTFSTGDHFAKAWLQATRFCLEYKITEETGMKSVDSKWLRKNREPVGNFDSFVREAANKVYIVLVRLHPRYGLPLASIRRYVDPNDESVQIDK